MDNFWTSFFLGLLIFPWGTIFLLIWAARKVKGRDPPEDDKNA